MRLLTHNSLLNRARDATTGYPLLLEAEEVRVRPSEGLDLAFVRHIAPSLHWRALKIAAAAVGFSEANLPEELTRELLEDDAFVEVLQKLLLDVHVVRGTLVCPDTGRRFPIEDGVPDMSLPETEVGDGR